MFTLTARHSSVKVTKILKHTIVRCFTTDKLHGDVVEIPSKISGQMANESDLSISKHSDISVHIERKR